MKRTTKIGLVVIGLMAFSCATPVMAYHYPRVGRFLSRDPIGESGGLNLQRISGNDAINHVDPLGLAPATAVDMLAGLKGICAKECKCRCQCSTSRPTSAPGSQPASSQASGVSQ